MKRVGALLLLACCSLSTAHAQSWKDLVNKTKDKAKRAAGVGDTASPTARSAQAARVPASQPWYMSCGAPHGFTRYVTKPFAVSHDPKAFLAALAAWKSFAHDQYGAYGSASGGSCTQYPSEQQARDETARGEQALLNSNRSQPEQYRYTISEVDWTPDSAPAVAGATATASGQDHAPTLGAAVAAGPLVYTYCAVVWGSPDFATTAYVTAVFPTHKQDPPTMSRTYVVPFREFILEKYHVARGHRYNKGSTCDDGYSTEALATARRQDVLTQYKNNSGIKNVIETGWTGGGQAGTSAPD